MVNDVILGTAVRNTVTSINRTQAAFDQTSLRLATGLKVNSALDNPSSFFTAKTLTNRASDFSKLLDGIGISLRTLEETQAGIDTLTRLLRQGQAIAERSRDALRAGNADPSIVPVSVNTPLPSLNTEILLDLPVTYYRLDETSGPIVDYGTLAPVAATYSGGAAANAAPLYTNEPQPSVSFDGVNDRISVADAAHINASTTTARSVELVFNANTTSGRQILYEEGGDANGFTIYIDNGLLYFTAEDDDGAQRFFDLNINTSIVAGQTYHAAFVFDGPNRSFSGYLNGIEVGRISGLNSEGIFPVHNRNTGIGGMDDGAQFHDGNTVAASGFFFSGRISNVAIYNRVLGAADFARHAQSLDATTSTMIINKEYNIILEQINLLILDANYRGINLLAGDDLTTYFNEDHSNFLFSKGVDFSFEGLGLISKDFSSLEAVEGILDSLEVALDTVRNYARSITSDLSIIKIRNDFTRNLINNHLAGADDLTVADQNEEGANLLAVQTRLALGQTALSLVTQSQASVLSLFTGNGN